MNLRDKGYPSAKSYRPNRSEKRDLLQRDNVYGTPFPVDAIDVWHNVPVEKDPTLLDRILTAYNNKAFGTPGALMMQKWGRDFSDDEDSYGHESGLNLMRNGNRLGYASKEVTPDQTAYNLGVDLDILPDGYADKSFDTPFGKFTGGYEDDVLYGNLEVPSRKYYLAAIKSLLDRGTF